MKRQVVAPIEQGMRFFTPQLFLQANSHDDEVADRADRAWEAAIKKYTKHLNAIDSKLHADVRRLSKICLHDAELIGFETNVPYPVPLPSFEPPYRPSMPHMDSAVLFLRDRNSNQLLIYSLSDEVDLTPTKNWPFPRCQKLWLYDEVDLDERGGYVHRVLFNDGSVVKIPFWSVVMKVSPKEQVVETAAANSN